MLMTFIFPRREADLLTFLKDFSGRLSAGSPAVWGLTAAQITELATLVSAYDVALVACAPTTRSQATVAVKNEAREAAKSFAYNMAMIVAVNPALSPAQLLELGIRPRATPTYHGRPTTRPGVDVVSVSNRTVKVKVHFTGPNTPEKNGITSAFVYTFVGETYPTDPSLWEFAGPATRTRSEFPLVFPDTVAAGAKVWICAAWCSARGETGPVSLPVSTNLQGGGVSDAGLKIAA